MGAKTKTIERPTAASPLAEDVIKKLQGLLSEGAFGTGVGPLQQEAGTAIRQFVNSGGAPMGPSFEELVPALEAVNTRDVNRGAADLREGMGIMGTRLGSTLATGEGRFRESANQNWQAQLTQLADMVTKNNMARSGQQLGAMGMMHQMGQENMNPFMQLAQLGLIPPEIIASPNPWLQLGTAALGGAGEVAKKWAGGG